MFLLINLVYFLAPPLSDFNLSLAEQWVQWYGGWARELVDARLAARGLELAEYAHRFELEAYSLAKLIVVLHPLLMAPVLALMFWHRRVPLVDHLAVALLGVVGGYVAMALRRVYGVPRIWLVPGAIAVWIGGAIGHMLIYRPVLFYLAFGLS